MNYLLGTDIGTSGTKTIMMDTEGHLIAQDLQEYDVLTPKPVSYTHLYEATRQIRQLTRPDAANIPIVAMTANAFSEDVEKSIQSGMNDHISKPIDLNEGFMKLKTLLHMDIDEQ